MAGDPRGHHRRIVVAGAALVAAACASACSDHQVVMTGYPYVQVPTGDGKLLSLYGPVDLGDELRGASGPLYLHVVTPRVVPGSTADLYIVDARSRKVVEENLVGSVPPNVAEVTSAPWLTLEIADRDLGGRRRVPRTMLHELRSVAVGMVVRVGKVVADDYVISTSKTIPQADLERWARAERAPGPVKGD